MVWLGTCRECLPDMTLLSSVLPSTLLLLSERIDNQLVDVVDATMFRSSCPEEDS